ncbi:hypothetical protein Kpol_526p36 [Vanderwaltozyma polyspora DSM 70294]|uniref:t-SNARE coiled-coil homology domain-containing protein n=1 Tax=Vanderwaltozyma polyspora (strain ATCC 22028 / DSM 70294 / BCRC 21397 / CBS 2163 / NBRC 10782 / NRRL Y-8283 / UCD 57-17) TaxID=436907 RepID=A7TLU1_VANPO|nr:uncharacterized protein Kpol_526p36 [Vanderwaltozyma polyspora DSM 70294]EDO16783.1 hypothetical protein Kpol_526p36 [Vanderwaltozyma polyspora DSM 70294]
MSYFNDVVEEVGELAKFSDSPEFDGLRDAISEQLFEINGQISTLQQYVGTLEGFLAKTGTMNMKVIDNIDKKTIQNIGKVSELVKKVNTDVVMLDKIDVNELDKLQVLARDKLTRDLSYSLREFQNIQQGYTKVIKSINDRARSELDNQNSAALMLEEEGETGSNRQPDTSTSAKNIVIQREALNNEEFAYQQNLIRQRDEEIVNIERGITELNGLFTDLSHVIQQQGSMVDNIEANIYSVADNTQLASRELDKALRYQRKSSKWCLYLLMLLSGMFFFMMLIILI